MAESSGNGAGARRPGDGVNAPAFPKRFYKAVSVEPTPAGGYALRLDGRPARTPGRNLLDVPTRAMADALATEWNRVAEVIDPRQMPLTRLVNTAIDGVARTQAEVLAEVATFAGSDLLAYRAGEPDELVRAQNASWNPVIAWAREELGATFVLAEGVIHVAQPAETLDRMKGAFVSLAGEPKGAPFRVAALHVMTTLTGSALLAAAVASERLTADEAWEAAHVDEDHQISLWGEDAEAAARRGARWAEMRAASEVYRLSDPDRAWT